MAAPIAELAALTPSQRAAVLRRVRERAGVRTAAADAPVARPLGVGAPATYVQQQQHYLHATAPDVPNYTTAFVVELTGPLDRDRLGRALALVVAGHEALRTRILRVGKVLVQDVDPDLRVELPVRDHRSAHDPRRAGWDRAESLARTVFDPDRAPLWRAELQVLDAERHLLVWAAAHSIFDGASMGVLLHNLADAYRSGRAPASPLQLGDVAVWERERLAGSRRDELLGYWRAQLVGLSPLDFPLDRMRPRRPVLMGAVVHAPLLPALLERVDTLARSVGMTRFGVLLAAYHLLLAQLADRGDIAVGVPLDGRIRPILGQVIGCLTNTVVVRCTVDSAEAVREFLERMQTVIVDAIEHQDLPLGQLVEDLRPPRDGVAPPLVQTLFNYAGLPAAVTRRTLAEGLDAQLHGLSNQSVRYDFELSIDETPDGVRLRFDYGPAVLEAATAEHILAAYVQLVEALVDPTETTDALVGDLPVAALSGADRQCIPAPGAQSRPAAGAAASASSTVDIVAELWAEALEIESVPLDTDFFTLGGSSLLAVVLGERIAERTGVHVALLDLLTATSVVELATIIDEEKS